MSEHSAYPAPAGDGFSGATAPPRPPGLGARVTGACILLMGTLAAASLVTWSANDPSLMHLSTAKPTNALGALGAIFSDFVLTALGLASILALLPPLYWALQLLSGAALNRFQARALAAPVATLAFAAFFSSLPRAISWPLPSGYGGLLGDLLHSGIASTVESLGTERASLLAALLALGAGSALMTFALGLSRDDLKAMARFAARPFEPDSSWVAGLKQGGGAGSPLAPLTAVAAPHLTQPGFNPPPLSLTPDHQSAWTTHHGHHGRGFTNAPIPHAPLHEAAVYVGTEPPIAARDAGPRAAVPTNALMQAYGETPAPITTMPVSSAPIAAAPQARAPIEPAAPAPAVEPLRTEPPRPVYKLPSTSLLPKTSTPRAKPLEMSIAEKLRGDRLRDVLAAYAVPGNVTSHWTGPVVTTFVFEPEAGTKSARVLGLADDIARALGVAAVRLQLAAGRGALVIEVPHDDALAIGMRDLVEQESFDHVDVRLPLTLGATSQGEPAIADLATLPNLLIAGRHAEERAGVLRALTASLTYRHTPETLSLAIADADGSLGALAVLPHCSGHAPIVEADEAVELLAWAASEIDARSLRLRALAHTRTIEAFNARIAYDAATSIGATVSPMPYLVVVVTDLAPLVATDAPALDYALQRIAREGAAVGVHLIAATSRMDDRHFPDAIRAAFVTRVALTVSDRPDSRAVLDETGAEDLLGQGDSLATTSSDDVRRGFGGGTLSRLHLTRLTLEDAYAVAAACQPVATSATVVTSHPTAAGQTHSPLRTAVPVWTPAAPPIDDALYGRAVSLVRRVDAIDAGMFRRGLAVTYAEALALLDRLVSDRLIGPENSDGTHPVLIGRAA